MYDIRFEESYKKERSYYAGIPENAYTVICYGDSNTWGFDPRNFVPERYSIIWPDLLAEKKQWKVENQGENGREIPRKSVYFPRDSDLVIVMLGINDLLQSRSPEVVAKRMEDFLMNQNREKILLIAPPALTLGVWVQDQNLITDSIVLAKQYQLLAQRLDIRFVDASQWQIPMAFDGVHFTEEGHRIFSEKLYNYLNEGAYK